MNNIVAQSILQADGRYLTDTELGSLEHYMKTYDNRLNAYLILCEKSDAFIQQALDRIAPIDQQAVQDHENKCKRDMSLVLRAVAVSVLKDDEVGFREQVLLWMQNIMTALRKENQSARAYRLLQDAIQADMSAESASLVNDYLTQFIQALTKA